MLFEEAVDRGSDLYVLKINQNGTIMSWQLKTKYPTLYKIYFVDFVFIYQKITQYL
jgi:hypothetical protein